MIEADLSELDDLVGDLAGAAVKVAGLAVVAVDASAKAVRDDARERAPRKDLPHYAATITHDVEVGPSRVSAEVGPELGGQGSLGHILEDGTATSPPHPHLQPALEAREDTFVSAVADVGVEAMK